MLAVSLFVFLVLLLGLGFWSTSNIENEEDYLVAGRRLPLSLAFGTLVATWFGADSVIGSSEAAYEEGMRGVILDPFGCGLALMVAGLFFARRLWEMKLFTTGDLYRNKFGPKTELISSVIQSLGYLPWIAGQYLALGKVLLLVYGIPVNYGIVISAAICIALTLSGGMWAVTITDSAQLVIMFIGLAIVFIDIMIQLGGGSFGQGITNFLEQTDPEMLSIMPELETVAMLAWASYWAIGVFGNIPGQDLMQRVFASKSSRVAVQACLLAGVVYIIFGLIPVVVGILARHQEVIPGEGEAVMLTFMRLRHGAVLMTMFIISLTACIISTATSATLSPSSLLGRNILGQFAYFRQQPLWVNRFAVVLVTCLSLPFAYLSESIHDLLSQSLGIALVGLFIPFVVATYCEKRHDHAGVISVLAGTLVWLGHLTAIYLLPLSENPAAPSSLLIEWIHAIPPEFTGITACAIAFVIYGRHPESRSLKLTETHPPLSPVQPDPATL
jgi:SSS family solute:Na+ symporter